MSVEPTIEISTEPPIEINEEEIESIAMNEDLSSFSNVEVDLESLEGLVESV